MDDEILKIQIGTHIATYRKRSGLTQAALAEKLNYSDKAVSKWERGESIPDVLTLVQLGALFGVTLDDLVAGPEGPVQPAPEKPKADKGVILALSSTLVWFVALLVFVVLSSFPALFRYSWIPFFFAVPVNAIVLLSLLSAWRKFRWNRLLISVMVWGFLIALYGTGFIVFRYNFWKLFLLGIPGQAAIFLWFRLFGNHKDKEAENHG